MESREEAEQTLKDMTTYKDYIVYLKEQAKSEKLEEIAAGILQANGQLNKLKDENARLKEAKEKAKKIEIVICSEGIRYKNKHWRVCREIGEYYGDRLPNNFDKALPGTMVLRPHKIEIHF